MPTSLATCHLCEALCGIVVEHDGAGRIGSIRGDDDDVFSRGHICPKAAALADIHADPDRVRTPLRRRGTGWEEIGWDEALAEAAERLAAIQKRHGRDAVAIYAGNPTAHNDAALLYAPLFLATLGTRNVYTANSVDGLPRLLASRLMYGSFLRLPVPDLGRTDYLLILGANPAVSNGSVMTAPGCRRRLKELRARGGRIVVLDPRRTETAELADEHHFVRPGTDAHLLLAFLHVIFAEGLARPERCGVPVRGIPAVARLAAAMTPERAAIATGIDAATIRRLARELATAPTAVCYGRMGTCTQQHGAAASWLIDLCNIATGNLDRAGGAMFTTPAADLASLSALVGQPGTFARYRSRVSGLPEFHGELPVAALAEEMETPGPGQIRALVAAAGNPVLSCPNGGRIERALPGLELMVAIDLYVNETTRHAHLILPPTFGLEKGHYGLVTRMVAVENVARYATPVLAPPAGVRPEWWILGELSRRILGRRGVVGRVGASALRALPGPDRMLDLLIRMGPHGRGLLPFGRGLTLRSLAAATHGVHLGPLQPRLRSAMRGRAVDAAPPALVQAVERMLLADAAPPELSLVGRRHLLSNNSWMHNSARLMKGADRCTLQVHPEDAARLEVATGELVRVTSRVGQVRVPVEVTPAVMPGVVSLPHGHGHGRDGVQLGVAAGKPGASANDLTDDAVREPVTGCAVLSGVSVAVVPAGAPRESAPAATAALRS